MNDLTEKCFLSHMELLKSIFSVIVRFDKTLFAPDPGFRSNSGRKFTFICWFPGLILFHALSRMLFQYSKSPYIQGNLSPTLKPAFPPKYSFRKEANHHHNNNMMGV